MKLELKHLAPYLPYGLKGQFKLSDVIELQPGQKDEIRNKELAIQQVSFFYEYCKPILRPLSDLTNINTIDSKQIQINLLEFDGDVSLLSYQLFQVLLELHFDVFGLIEQGLATDINTLKK